MKDAGFKETLKRLGHKTYRDYLRSDLWQKIKRKVFAIKGRVCVCGKPATTVHHKSYDARTMLGLRIKSLVPMCDKCHYKIEFSGSQKMTLSQANKRLKRRRAV